MLSAISNTLPIHLRPEFESTERRVDVAPTGGAPGLPNEELQGFVTDRPAVAPGERSDAGRDPEGQEEGDSKRLRSGETTEARETGDEPERPGDLSEEEKQEVQRLRARDQEVRRHEQAHAAAGGAHAGSPKYELQSGPDGRQYAVEGSVSVNVAPVAGDPQATVAKMQQVKRAAMAPASPSGADRKVAAQAASTEAKAQQAIQQQRAQEIQQSTEELGESTRPSGEAGAAQSVTDGGNVSSLGEATAATGAVSGPVAAFSSGASSIGGVPGAASPGRPAAAAQAYAATSFQAPGPTMSVLACQNCGGAHST